MIKEEVLKNHISNIFRNCEKFFSHDALSMRISKVLEAHYLFELKNFSKIKNKPFLKDTKELLDDQSDKQDKKKKDKKDKKDKKKKDKKKKKDDSDGDDDSLGLFDEENQKKQKMFENITKYLTIE